MGLINIAIKWIMIVSDLFTCSTFIALTSPTAGLEVVFGDHQFRQPDDEIVIRNWGR